MTAIVDDVDAIRRRLGEMGARAFTGEPFEQPDRCFIRSGRKLAECWCYQAGPGGSHLPCPSKP